MVNKKKSKKTQVQLVKGMKDILPSEQAILDFIKQRVFTMAQDYGFGRIETPIVEATALFKRTIGEETDVVSKEMYSFVDQGGEKLSLRPENTAGVVRAYIEHGMLNLPQPVKLFYFAPQFRHDKPQAGRYRQFWQLGFEVIGETDPIIDAQLISMSYFLLKELGISAQVQVNSIGDDKCRPRYIKALAQYFKEHKKDLCPDCQKRLLKNPLRLLDCKVKKCQDLGQQAPQMVDYLCDDCNKDFTLVLEYLDELDINYTLNSKIVRGLDYYSKTAWEIVEESEEGKLQALGGGGRYDALVSMLGGRETPAIGFAMGVERIIQKIKDNKVELPAAHRPDVYIAQLGEEARKKSLLLIQELRAAGLSIAEDIYKNGLKNQLELADKKQVRYALILGQKEISDETILIRDMESGVQETVDYKKVVKEIQKRLSTHVVEKVLRGQTIRNK